MRFSADFIVIIYLDDPKVKRKQKKKVAKIVSFDDVSGGAVAAGAWSSTSSSSSAPHAAMTFTSASLPCPTAIARQRDSLGQSVESASALSVSTESSSERSCDAAAAADDKPEVVIASSTTTTTTTTVQSQQRQPYMPPVAAASVRSKHSVMSSSQSARSSDISYATSNSNSQSNSSAAQAAGFGFNLLRRVSSKTSVDSATSVTSSKSEQQQYTSNNDDVTLQPSTRSIPAADIAHDVAAVKGHHRGHSDTSLFAGLGSRLVKSVMSTVSRRQQLSSEEVQFVDSSQTNTTDATSLVLQTETLSDSVGADATMEMFRSSSVGSFDNVSLLAEDMSNSRQRNNSNVANDDVTLPATPAATSNVFKHGANVTAGVATVSAGADGGGGASGKRRVLHESLSTGALPRDVSGPSGGVDMQSMAYSHSVYRYV